MQDMFWDLPQGKPEQVEEIVKPHCKQVFYDFRMAWFPVSEKKLKPCRKNNFRNKTWTCDSKAALQQKFHAEQKTKHELDDVACMFSSIKLHLSERTFLSILYELSGFQVLWKIMCMMEEFLPQASLVTAFLVLFSALSHP